MTRSYKLMQFVTIKVNFHNILFICHIKTLTKCRPCWSAKTWTSIWNQSCKEIWPTLTSLIFSTFEEIRAGLHFQCRIGKTLCLNSNNATKILLLFWIYAEVRAISCQSQKLIKVVQSQTKFWQILFEVTTHDFYSTAICHKTLFFIIIFRF